MLAELEVVLSEPNVRVLDTLRVRTHGLPVVVLEEGVNYRLGSIAHVWVVAFWQLWNFCFHTRSVLDCNGDGVFVAACRERAGSKTMIAMPARRSSRPILIMYRGLKVLMFDTTHAPPETRESAISAASSATVSQ